MSRKTHHENPCVDPFLNNNKCEVRAVVGITLLASLFKLRNLVFLHEFQLTISNAISEDDYLLRQLLVHFLVCHQRHVQWSAKTVHELFFLALDDRLTVPFSVGSIQWSNKAWKNTMFANFGVEKWIEKPTSNRISTVSSLVESIDSADHHIAEWNLDAPQGSTKLTVHLKRNLLDDGAVLSVIS